MSEVEQVTNAASGELHVYEFGVDCFVAASEEDAKAIYIEHHRMVGDEDESEIVEHSEDVWLKPDADTLGILLDEDGEPTDSGEATRKTCGEWARENGRGFLCTSEF